MQFFTIVLFFIVLASYIPKAFSYPHYIGHGYTSCLNCHFQPFGGGPLNDYGRSVSATLLSDRLLYSKKTTEKNLADMSGFFFKPHKQQWLRLQANYRGFQLVRNPGGEKQTKEWINMQEDVRLILRNGADNRFIAVLNYGYAPTPRNAPPGTDNNNYRSREHYVGAQLSQNFRLYAGLMDKLYGIKIVEHIAFSRERPQVAMNDQVHGSMLHFLNPEWEGGIHYFVGNMAQDEEVRSKGWSTQIEKTILGEHRVGASYMNSGNEFLKLQAFALHSKFSLKEGSSVLAEFGQTNRTSVNTQVDQTSRYGLLQTSLRPGRGFYILSNIEYLKNDTKEDDYVVRWGPALQYMPIQRLELRLDIYNNRIFSENSSSKDTWFYLLQTHLWF